MTESMAVHLERARAAFGQRQWESSCRSYQLAAGEGDQSSADLSARDLEAWATSAYLTGRRDEGRLLLERLYEVLLGSRDVPAAAKAAFMLAFNFLETGEMSRANAWLGRSKKLLEPLSDEGAAHGYLLLPRIQQLLGTGELEEAFEVAGKAALLGEADGDSDLITFARHAQGVARLRQGRSSEGLALLDEAMLAALSEEVSPIWMGLLYCSAISACRSIGALLRMGEWTNRLERWCSEQSEMLTFRGECHLYRAELLKLRGDWDTAVQQARDAVVNPAALATTVGLAWYQIAEVERLRGNYDAAEEGYLRSSAHGMDPQPGLGLLRLDLGQPEAAASSLARALVESRTPYARARILHATVRVALARKMLAEARDASEHLSALVDELTGGEWPAASEAEYLAALALEARGLVLLAQEQWDDALPALRSARTAYGRLEALYEGATVSLSLGLACLGLGDREGFLLEARSAHSVFTLLAARPALAQLLACARDARLSDELIVGPTAAERTRSDSTPDLLTPREREVLALVAKGFTNGEIGSELGISNRTVDRHLSNIFDRLGVNSRAAAVARATALSQLPYDAEADG